MENIEKFLPVTKEDNQKLLKKHKPILTAFTIFFAIALIVCIYLILLFNSYTFTVLTVSGYIFVVSMFYLVLYVGFISPLKRDKATGKKRQLTGIITNKSEKVERSGTDDWITRYFIVLGATEEIEVSYNEYVKVKVNQKIKIELLANSKSVIDIEILSEKEESNRFLDNIGDEIVENLSEQEKKYLKIKLLKKVKGVIVFFTLLGFIFYFILKVIVVAIVYNGLNLEPSQLFFDVTPLILLIIIMLLTLYFRTGKIIKDINLKKKKIVRLKIDDKIKSNVNYNRMRNFEKTTKTVARSTIFNKKLWIHLGQAYAKSFSGKKTKLTGSKRKYSDYFYLIANKFCFKVSHRNFDNFEINEPVYVHLAINSNLPVFLQSHNDKSKIIDISKIYGEKILFGVFGLR